RARFSLGPRLGFGTCLNWAAFVLFAHIEFTRARGLAQSPFLYSVSGRQFRQHFVRNLQVGIDVLHVIIVFERVAQAQNLLRHGLVGDCNYGIGDESKLLALGSDARFSERLSYSIELIGSGDDKIRILLICQFLRSRLQSQLKNSLLVDGRARNDNLHLAMEHVRNASTRSKVAVVLGEDATDFGRGTVLIICGRFRDHRHASRCVTLVGYFIEVLCIRSFAGAAFDGALDVVVRHAGRTRRQDGAAQSWISIGIAAAFRRNRNLLRKLAENLTALGVNSAFEAFYLQPLAVSRHNFGRIISVKARLARNPVIRETGAPRKESTEEAD